MSIETVGQVAKRTASAARVSERRKERRLVAKYLREVGENECGFSQLECDELAERIERGLHRRTP